MPGIHIHFGDELSAPNMTQLKNKVDKTTIDLEYELGDTDLLTGKFVNTLAFQKNLWSTLNQTIELKGNIAAPKVGGGAIDRPGIYALEAEAKGYSYKGKIVFKRKSGDKTTPQIAKNTHPPKVVVKPAGAKLASFDAKLKKDLDDLLKEMKKPANYAYSGTPGNVDKGWATKLGKHHVHPDPGTKSQKAEVDVITNRQGTKWRMYFDLDFSADTKTLTVSLTDLKMEHKSGGRA
jgi:hypothetical protein